MSTEPAPLYRDAFLLAEWVQRRFATLPEPLPQTIARRSLTLLELIALALRGYDRLERAVEADEQLLVLRTELRLAEALALIDERQMQHVLERCDQIGRQLGGWQRRLTGS